MTTETEEKELLFLKSKQSMQEIIGWKIFIFLPQNLVWRFFIIFTVIVSTVLCITRCFFGINNGYIDFAEFACDIFYFADVVLSTMHFAMVKTRKLRHGKRRSFVLLIIDYISLLPLTIIYEHILYSMNKKDKKRIFYFRLNVVLRVYRIPKCFFDVKNSTYKVKTYFVVNVFEIFSYFLLLTHFFSCLIVLYFDENQKSKCLNNLWDCMVENELITLSLLGQSFTPPFSNYPLENYKLLLIADFVVGYLFIYGYVIPINVFVSLKRLTRFFEYSRKWDQLNILIKNMEVDKELKAKILDYFHYAWTYGKGDRRPEILKVFPLCLMKNIFCDMHWDAISHSELFQGLSMGCKRSLALQLRTEFVLPKTTLFHEKEKNIYFIYLEAGSLQIMSHENSKSPMLNFSGGTVLREMSFFLQTETAATVRVAEFSIIHLLNFRDFFRVLSDYPKDMKKIIRKVKMRLKLAKSTHENKVKINPEFSYQELDSRLIQGNIKWIKHQYRAIFELQKAENLKKMSFSKEADYKYEQQIRKLDTQLQHTSVHLPLICLGGEKMRHHESICIRMSFPWLLDPQCHFLFFWKILVSILGAITVLLYPAYIGWFPRIPRWFFSVSLVISLVYLIDVLLQLITAVKVKNTLISKFTSIVAYRLSCWTFYVDILAALPIQLLIYVDKKLEKRFALNLYLANALLKVYKLIPIINSWTYSPKPGASFRTFIKYILILIVCIYFTAALINMTDVECVFYACGQSLWYPDLVEKIGKERAALASAFKAMFLALDIPNENKQTDVYTSYLISLCLLILFHFFFVNLQAECIATYVMEFTYELEYRKLMKFVYNFMGTRRMVGRVRNRMLDTMKFQWDHDKGSYITEGYSILKELSADLKNEFSQKSLLPILAKSKLFEWEDEHFLMDLCQKAYHVALPEKSLLLSFGVQPMYLYVVHKGTVQLNSFISGDLHMNVANPIIVKGGSCFPVIDAFSQTPAAVTAIAITDCQLVWFDFEDVLEVMTTHGVLKDFVEAVKETNLSGLNSAKLGVTLISDPLAFDKDAYETPFKKLKCLGRILKVLLRKQAIDSYNARYVFWELSRIIFILFGLISWPPIFAFSCKSDSRSITIFICILLGLDCISCVDFYVRLHVAYYNKKGLYVNHPLHTSWHYLTTSFVVDLIAFLPNFHMLYLVYVKTYDFHVSVAVTHVLMRSVSFYRVTGFLNYLNDKKKIIYLIKLITYVFWTVLGVHYYINIMIYFHIRNESEEHLHFLEGSDIKMNKFFKYYLNELILILSMILGNKVHFENENLYDLGIHPVFAVFGLLGQIYVYSYLTLSSTTSNKNLTTYQYYMKSFVQYLNTQKADDSIAALAIQHFEHEWVKQKGYDPHQIFSRFPRTLHEDIMFPLYKKTLAGTDCLSKANDSFYRSLSRNIQEVHLEKGSVIIFQKQVQEDIFFLHKGICAVENVSAALYKGSIMGDIRLQGIMKNNITAKTSIILLKVSSKHFFLTINNFYNTKMAFQSAVAVADDFIESVYVEERKSFLKTLSLEKNDLESEFVPVTEDQGEKSDSYGIKRARIINPKSFQAQLLGLFFMFVAYFTIVYVPLFMAIRIFTPLMLFLIYLLDVFWIIKIILTARTAYFDKKTRNFISSKKAIMHRYLRLFDGLIIHVLSVLPIELIPLAYFGRPISNDCCFVMSVCYVNRLFRAPFIFTYLHKGSKRLLVNFYKGLLGILMTKTALLNFCVSIDIAIKRDKKYKLSTCQWSVSYSEMEVILSSYLCVLNLFVGSGMPTCTSESFLEEFFQLFIGLWSILSKTLLLNQVLMIMYVMYHNKSDAMYKLEQLEKYLSVRDVSPALFQRAQKYFCDLIDSFKEGAEPYFLRTAPNFIKTSIMHDLYTYHLKNCYAFQGIDDVFVKQLAERLERYVFFPGDYITEKGDVDHSMYFIHRGEVHCIESNENIKALEIMVDLYVTGEYFGVLQGVFLFYPHTNTYRAKTLSDILVLNYHKWKDLREAFPEVTELIYKKCLDKVPDKPANETHV